MFGKQHGKVGRIVGVVGFALVLAATAFAGPVAAATTAWQYVQLDNDPAYDMVLRDSDGNGNFDDIWYDANNDGKWDLHLYNSKGSDALLEELTYNPDGDGYFDLWATDTNQRIGFDAVYLNPNDDGYWDSVVTASTPKVANVQFSEITFSNSGGSVSLDFPTISPNPNYSTPAGVFAWAVH